MPQTPKIDELYIKIEAMLSKIEAGADHKEVIRSEMSSMDDSDLKELIITVNRYISEISGDESILSLISGNVEDAVDILGSILELIGRTKDSNSSERSTTTRVPAGDDYSRPSPPSLVQIADIKKDIKDGIMEGLAETTNSEPLKEAVSDKTTQIQNIDNNASDNSRSTTNISNTSNTTNLGQTQNNVTQPYIQTPASAGLISGKEVNASSISITNNTAESSSSKDSTLIIKEYLDRYIENNRVNNIESQLVSDVRESKESAVKLVNNNNLKQVNDMHVAAAAEKAPNGSADRPETLPVPSGDKTNVSEPVKIMPDSAGTQVTNSISSASTVTSTERANNPLYISNAEYNSNLPSVSNMVSSPVSSRNIKNIYQELGAGPSTLNEYNAVATGPTTISSIDASLNDNKNVSYSEFDKSDAIPKDVNISLTGVETRLDSMLEYLKNRLASDIASAVQKNVMTQPARNAESAIASQRPASPSYEPGSLVGSK